MNLQQTKKLTTSAMLLALATAISFICGLIPFLNFPFGGGITIASMLPIVVISYMYGVRWGLLSGFVYAVLQMFLGHTTISALFLPGSDSYMGVAKALVICLIDYVIAYTLLGLGGLFRKRFASKTRALVLGSVTALSFRYLAHIVSGAIFYGAWADWFFSDPMAAIGGPILDTFSGAGLAIVYSIVYNGCYMIPELIITSLAAVAVSRIRQINSQKVA